MEFARKQHTHFLQPLPGLLQRSFKRLGYAKPELEAELLLLLVESLWKLQATGAAVVKPTLLDFIKTKYQPQW